MYWCQMTGNHTHFKNPEQNESHPIPKTTLFSREYSRMFGYPPKEDIKRLRENDDETINA